MDRSTTRRDEFLSVPRIAVVATESASGRPHLSPVWFQWDRASFSLVISPRSRKHRHLERRSRMTVCVDERAWPYKAMSAECTTEIVDVVRGYPRWMAERYLDGDDLEGFLDQCREQDWALVRATPVRWTGS